MRSVLARGAAFRFKAGGGSMAPFIGAGDVLTISRIHNNDVRVGDVAAVVKPSSHCVIVHRVVARNHHFVIVKGDNCSQTDGAFPYDAIVGRVTNIERNGSRAKLSLFFNNTPARGILAILSRTTLLNTVFLPLLRTIKKAACR